MDEPIKCQRNKPFDKFVHHLTEYLEKSTAKNVLITKKKVNLKRSNNYRDVMLLNSIFTLFVPILNNVNTRYNTNIRKSTRIKIIRVF